MTIKDIVVHLINTPLEIPFKFSQGYVYSRSSVIVEVISSDGTSGFGECLCHGMQPPQVAQAMIDNCYKPRILGESIYNIEVIWEKLYNISRPFGQQGVAVNALSGVDIALWDLLGKTLNQPISQLLGGRFREEIKPYATGFYREEAKTYPKDGITEAMSYVEMGFKAMKLKCGFGVEHDIEYIKAIREAIGFDIKLMADFNCAYSQNVARKILLETEECKLEFFEELLAPEDMRGYAEIRNLTSSSIAAGENIFGKQNFKEWLNFGALDIYQPDLCSSGGFTELKKVAALAQSYNTPMIPHVWGSGIGLAASLQFVATLPPTPLSDMPVEPMLEYDRSSHPFRTELINGEISMEQGMVKIPNNAGIGVSINRNILEKYKI
ncbi:MAG: mandelate racemase/muconate lactonizing enzyme family protein [Eubacteriales bacterium]